MICNGRAFCGLPVFFSPSKEATALKTLVEIYDASNVIDNVLVSYLFQPDRVVFLSDSSSRSKEGIDSLRNALTARFPNMKVFQEILDNSEQVEKVCERLVATYPDPVFDLTGGQDVIGFAVTLFCYERVRPCICIDWQQRRLICNEAAEKYRVNVTFPQMTIENMLQMNGATLQRKMHNTPPKSLYEPLVDFYEETLRFPKNWLSTCKYLQIMASKAEKEGHPMSFTGNSVITDRGAKVLRCHPDFAKLAYRLGFLKELEWKKTTVSITFANETVLRYLTSQGTWLELYVYITAMQSGSFSDCKMSVVIYWDGIDIKRDNVIKEIDVILIRGCRPVFISCKTSVPSTENLNEIALYAKRFGGNHAIPMLVTTTDVRSQSATTYYRAQELGVILVERKDLLKENGLLHILENIKG